MSLREILDLPQEVKKSDFVVRLTEGVAHGEALLRNTAITPDLKGAFDRALTLVGAALRDKQSVASYVHGSFGSGKSHFLALLSLLLANDASAWSERELHELLAKHEWVKTAKLLRLHFHMVGANSTEEKVFSEYLSHIRELHPDAPIPPLFEDAALFDNAVELQRTLGDAAFFSRLNAHQPAAKGWGKLAAASAWDAASFDAARNSGDPEVRARLFSSLVQTHFPAFAQNSRGFISFDRGLGIVTRHAASLGYDGIVLFLDELILWLASRATDRTFLSNEIQKLAKLVEAQDERRPIPLVSFLARQRDIREMVGDQYAGHEAQNLDDSLKWWEGRFNTIRLEDRNLPSIVEKRVVRAKDASAKKQLDDAFIQMRRSLGSAWGTLLGDVADEKSFRQVYPFSPALIEAVVALSACLQRERTALKVLVELLVDHLPDFELGKVVPVGDLFDALAGGEEPMDGVMRERFAAARRLYTSELLPVLQAQNGTGTKDRCQRLREDWPVSLGCSGCKEARCRTDNRLAKTLLLGALVPNSKVFKNLTVSRLVQLNHGTLRSPIPGTEATQAAGRLRAWASEVGKLRVGDQPDPTVAVILEGVDLKPILAAASAYDSDGARRKKIQEVLFTAMDLEASAPTVNHDVEWRGTRRTGSIHYGNVREMDDTLLRHREDEDFRVVIDYPFDKSGHSPVEDATRLERFLQEGGDSRSVVWLPSFFSEKVQRDLSDLVIIDGIVQGDFKRHVENLRPDDQLRARAELESLGSQKRQRVMRVLQAAYGLTSAGDGELDSARMIDRHFFVLGRGLEIRGLVSASLGDALRSAVHELLDQRYPRHPRLTEKATRARLEKNLRLFERICEADGQRLPFERAELKELELAHELGIVSVHEASAALRTQRFQDLEQELHKEGIQSPTVARVKRLLDPKDAMGLTDEVADFLVLAWALVSGRELLRGGNPVREPTPGKLPEDAELVKPPMPDPVRWQRALELSAGLFGISLGGKALHARNLRQLHESLEKKRKEAQAARAHEVEQLLVQRGLSGDVPRVATARAVCELLERLSASGPVAQVESLAGLEPRTSSTAMARHLVQARQVADCLDDDLVFNNFRLLEGRSEPEAQALLAELRRVCEADQLHEDLSVRVRRLSSEAQSLVQQSVRKQRDPREQAPPAPGIEVVGEGSVQEVSRVEAELARIREALQRGGPGAEVSLQWRVTRVKS